MIFFFFFGVKKKFPVIGQCFLVALFCFVFFFFFNTQISLLLQHAPLQYVILHARFVLVHGHMINYSSGFLFLDVLSFALRPFHFSVSKSLVWCKCFYTNDMAAVLHVVVVVIPCKPVYTE